MNLTDLVAKHCSVWKEKRCPKCGEDWPEDSQFYSRRPDGRLNSWCRACSAESTYAARERRKAA